MSANRHRARNPAHPLFGAGDFRLRARAVSARPPHLSMPILPHPNRIPRTPLRSAPPPILFALAALVFSASAGPAANPGPATATAPPARPPTAAPQTIAGLIAPLRNYQDEKQQGPPAAAAAAVCREVLAGGPDRLRAVIDLVRVPGKEPDLEPRYTLHALAMMVGQPGREADRALFVTALATALDGAYPAPVKSFLIAQLQLAGDPSAVPALARLLGDDTLRDDAARALAAIGGPAAAAALAQALAATPPTAARLPLIQALGAGGDLQSAANLQPLLADPDPDIRVAAARTLARAADATAADPLLAATRNTEPPAKHQLAAACLLLANRLVDRGDPAAAAKMFKELLLFGTGAADLHVRSAALLGLARTDRPANDALATIATALDDPALAQAAIMAGAATAGDRATGRWLQLLATATPERRAKIVTLLGIRRDPAARPALIAELAADNNDLAAPATAALGELGAAGDEAALGVLVDLLGSPEKSRAGGARTALARVPGTVADRLLAAALLTAPSAAAKEILDLLARRKAQEQLGAALAAMRDEDLTVRLAAIAAVGALGTETQVPLLLDVFFEDRADPKERETAERAIIQIGNEELTRALVAAPLLARLAAADNRARVGLIRLLGAVRPAAGLGPVRLAARDPDPEVLDAGIRALASWTDPAAADDLLAIARTTPDEKYHIMAVRGLAAMLRQKNVPRDKRFPLCEEALRICRRAEEKKQVLGAISGAINFWDAETSAAGLTLVEHYLGDDALTDEACSAAIDLARRACDRGPAETKAKAAAVARKVLDLTTNNDTKRRARELIDSAH